MLGDPVRTAGNTVAQASSAGQRRSTSDRKYKVVYVRSYSIYTSDISLL